MTQRIVIISDTQIPYHDRKAVQAVINFIGDFRPDRVIHIGDLMDYPQPSRFNKDTRAEFEGSVYQDSEKGIKDLLEPLRAVYDGPVGVLEGNHDLRPRTYLDKYAPALSGTRMFHMENLLKFDDFGIEKLPDFYDIAPDWLVTHGHLGGISLSRTTGITAVNAAKRFNKSIIMGHTHRLGVNWVTTGYDGRVVRQLAGMEVGNLMNMRLAGYLKRATANWQQGFGIVYVDGKHVQPVTVPITDGRFVVEGNLFRV